MSFFKLKHLFAGFMTLSAVTAFTLPQRILQGHVPAVDALFVPVARPSGAIARWAHNSFAAPELSMDTRDADVVRRENERLKNEVSTLSTRVEALEEAEYHRRLVGPIRDYCTPFAVASTDSGTRASLGIQGTSWQGLREGMVALYAEGIVGRIERAGLAGARVRLVTDSGFRIQVGFVRFDGAKFIRLKPLQSVTEGTGKGAMLITLLSREEAGGL
ncbi:MAG TPA: rod shape-determining protein MreC, partial [Tepidisphaeraceae bacterium]|nr:rod shape-determining protein MreC [Tepidisphaeraceae bacterium]